ncbi:PREDICTED: PRA1 family protein F1 [Tarenaya hassleriana]|uniref:PRA1 family protein F1 n=1 Tax=Tarenaya hassleriana TaxID=28532 RepID=UPI00053C678E|nr:PREDICTED: PRA1 family protein F1 [Tarenaya hassleriana]
MTTYGTNTTSSNSDLAPKLEYIARANDHHKRHALSTRRRPWTMMFDARSMSFPRKFATAVARVRTNTVYFQTNYAIVILFAVFLSLLWDPVSLIVLLALLGAWLSLYFLRDEPLKVFDRDIDDRLVLIAMSVVTLAVLFLTEAKLNVAAAIAVGAFVVVAHAAVRKTEDLYSNDEETACLVNQSG